MEQQNTGTLVAEGGRTLWVLGELVTYKVASEDSGGASSLFEEVGEEAFDRSTPPVMDGPPDVARLVATAARYGIEIPPPPQA